MLKRILRKVTTPFIWGYTSAELGLSNLSWSQFGEDLLVKNLFPRQHKGTYVDIGSFHPIHLSNTYFFYRSGWNGIAVDANAEFRPLYEKWRPKDIFINSVVGKSNSQVEFCKMKSAEYNCTLEHLEKVPAEFRQNFETIKIESRTLASIFDESGLSTCDFLNIDCEGADLEILDSNNWSKLNPSVICVEDHSANWQSSGVAAVLIDRDYVIAARAGLSTIFFKTV